MVAYASGKAEKVNIATDLAAQLAAFVAWCREHIRGDEKGEAQLFLDHLFRAFGHAGLREAGAVCEDRVKKDGGGTAFADLVWKPVVLVEMKKRGVDLSKHYRQAFDYWTRLVPGLPPTYADSMRLVTADCLSASGTA